MYAAGAMKTAPLGSGRATTPLSSGRAIPVEYFLVKTFSTLAAYTIIAATHLFEMRLNVDRITFILAMTTFLEGKDRDGLRGESILTIALLEVSRADRVACSKATSYCNSARPKSRPPFVCGIVCLTDPSCSLMGFDTGATDCACPCQLCGDGLVYGTTQNYLQDTPLTSDQYAQCPNVGAPCPGQQNLCSPVASS
jgi:hypothetical protein